MSEIQTGMAASPFERRRHDRYAVNIPVTLTKDGMTIASGSTQNISASGAGLQLYQPVVVGRRYKLNLSRHFSSTIRIVNGSMGFRYGAAFDGTDTDRRYLEERIAVLVKDLGADILA